MNHKSSTITINLFFLCILLSVAALACSPNIATSTEISEEIKDIDPGLIVFVGVDGNIYLTDIDGSDQIALSTDAVLPSENESEALYYQHPTWARDGHHLAYVQSQRSLTGESRDVVFIYNVATGESKKVYSSTNEFIIYPYWSPDNQNLSLLTNAAVGSSLLLQMTSLQAEVRVLDQGGPYYWSFSPSGQRALVHSGRDESGNPASLMKMLDLSSAEPKTMTVNLEGAVFQAPTWSQTGDTILTAIRLNDGRSQIVLLDVDANIIETITEVAGSVAFGLSPDGSKVAIIEKNLTDSLLFLGRLRVFDLDSGQQIYSSLESSVFAFFWSPDSEKLAIYSYQLPPSNDFEAASTTERLVSRAAQSDDSITISVEVYDLISAKTKMLTRRLAPSNGMMRVMFFFDQYQQSDTFWSPDSRWILVMGTPPGGKDGVWVFDSTAQEMARFLAEGVLAFWSWR